MLSAIVLTILQGTYRPYYLNPIFLPPVALIIIWLIEAPIRNALIYCVVAVLGLAFLWRVSSYDNGIGDFVYERALTGHHPLEFGLTEGDPFIDYVSRKIPAADRIYLLGPYGSVHHDPFTSMIRLGRPVPGRTSFDSRHRQSLPWPLTGEGVRHESSAPTRPGSYSGTNIRKTTLMHSRAILRSEIGSWRTSPRRTGSTSTSSIALGSPPRSHGAPAARSDLIIDVDVAGRWLGQRPDATQLRRPMLIREEVLIVRPGRGRQTGFAAISSAPLRPGSYFGMNIRKITLMRSGANLSSEIGSWHTSPRRTGSTSTSCIIRLVDKCHCLHRNDVAHRSDA